MPVVNTEVVFGASAAELEEAINASLSANTNKRVVGAQFDSLRNQPLNTKNLFCALTYTDDGAIPMSAPFQFIFFVAPSATSAVRLLTNFVTTYPSRWYSGAETLFRPETLNPNTASSVGLFYHPVPVEAQQNWGLISYGGGGIVTDPFVVNPRNYGAVGDGITDDTQAFKDAFAVVNASLEYRADPGTLLNDYPQARVTFYIPPGQYLITEEKVFLNTTPTRGAGLIVRGDGQLCSEIVYRPPEGPDQMPLVYHTTDNGEPGGNNVKGWGWTRWQNFSVLGQSSTASFWHSWSAGGCQNHEFTSVLWEDIHDVVRLFGPDTNSEYKFDKCTGIGDTRYLIHVGADGSDQNVNYWIHALTWHTKQGVVCDMVLGGCVNVVGGSLIHIFPNYPQPWPAEDIYYFKFYGVAHAGCTASFYMMGTRIEHRQINSKTMHIQWGSGHVQWNKVEDAVHSFVTPLGPIPYNYDPTQQNTIFIDSENLYASRFTFTNCNFQGYHKIKYGVAAYYSMPGIVYENCTFPNFADPLDVIRFERTEYPPDPPQPHGNIGGAPVVTFRNCKGIGSESTGVENKYLWEHTRNWQLHVNSQVPVQTLKMNAPDARMPIDTDGPTTVEGILPPNARIHKVRITSDPDLGGYTSFSAGQTVRIQNSLGTVIAELTRSNYGAGLDWEQAVYYDAGEDVDTRTLQLVTENSLQRALVDVRVEYRA